MIRKLKVALTLPEDCRIHQTMGSVLHGLLMEIVGVNTAEWLHDASGVRPYSQCVYFDKACGKAIWEINALTEQAVHLIQAPVERCLGTERHLKQKDWLISLEKEASVLNETHESLLEQSFCEDVYSRVGFQFLTTCSFKRNGRYVIYPDIFLLLQSLLAKWNAFAVEEQLEESDLLIVLAEACHVARYQLRSEAFSVDGHSIYGFSGNYQLKIYGNDMIRRIWNLLARYADFSGVGIKASLGMGAVRTTFSNKVQHKVTKEDAVD